MGHAQESVTTAVPAVARGGTGNVEGHRETGRCSQDRWLFSVPLSPSGTAPKMSVCNRDIGIPSVDGEDREAGEGMKCVCRRGWEPCAHTEGTQPGGIPRESQGWAGEGLTHPHGSPLPLGLWKHLARAQRLLGLPRTSWLRVLPGQGAQG